MGRKHLVFFLFGNWNLDVQRLRPFRSRVHYFRGQKQGNPEESERQLLWFKTDPTVDQSLTISQLVSQSCIMERTCIHSFISSVSFSLILYLKSNTRNMNLKWLPWNIFEFITRELAWIHICKVCGELHSISKKK